NGAYASIDAARANDVRAKGRLGPGPAIGSQEAHLLGLPGLQDHALAHGQRILGAIKGADGALPDPPLSIRDLEHGIHLGGVSRLLWVPPPAVPILDALGASPRRPLARLVARGRRRRAGRRGGGPARGGLGI